MEEKYIYEAGLERKAQKRQRLPGDPGTPFGLSAGPSALPELWSGYSALHHHQTHTHTHTSVFRGF